MRISKYIFIGIISLCMAAQGVTLFQICLGPGHSDAGIDWARECHSRAEKGGPREYSFGHEDHGCVDVFVLSVAGFGGSYRPDDQFHLTGPIALNTAALDHLCRTDVFSKQKTNLVPAFTDTTRLSIQSTILII